MHCLAIVEKGREATLDELDSLKKAMNEVTKLTATTYDFAGVIVDAYVTND